MIEPEGEGTRALNKALLLELGSSTLGLQHATPAHATPAHATPAHASPRQPTPALTHWRTRATIVAFAFAACTHRTPAHTTYHHQLHFTTLVPAQLDRPLVAVIDTGTTGVSVSDTLFDSGLLPTQWRDARIEMRSEKGATCALEASIRKKRKPSPGVPALDLPYSAVEYDEFPLVISPVRVPWFDPGFGNEECADGCAAPLESST